MGKELKTKHEFDKVDVFQSRSLARLTFVIKGEPDKTTPKLKEIYKLLRD